jgi:hypothetical protein
MHRRSELFSHWFGDFEWFRVTSYRRRLRHIRLLVDVTDLNYAFVPSETKS